MNLGKRMLQITAKELFSISSLSGGTHTITATYNGDDNFNGNSSSTFSQAIK